MSDFYCNKNPLKCNKSEIETRSVPKKRNVRVGTIEMDPFQVPKCFDLVRTHGRAPEMQRLSVPLARTGVTLAGPWLWSHYSVGRRMNVGLATLTHVIVLI